MPAAPLIAFDRRKYGTELQSDACAIRDIPGFITSPSQPHRLAFHEIALITRGGGQLEIDGEPLAVAPRQVLVTTPGETRRWRLTPAPGVPIEGMLVFFESDFVDAFLGGGQFLQGVPLFTAPAAARSLAVQPRAFDSLFDIAGQMRDELRCVRDDTGHALRAQVYRLLVALQRVAGDPVQRIDPARELAGRFQALLAERIALGDSVAAFARMLGVSARHLNACVRAATGRTAIEIIHARQMLEARRLLLNTNLTVADIAERLNFADASYFVRFFKRHAGLTPREYRLHSV